MGLLLLYLLYTYTILYYITYNSIYVVSIIYLGPASSPKNGSQIDIMGPWGRCNVALSYVILLQTMTWLKRLKLPLNHGP